MVRNGANLECYLYKKKPNLNTYENSGIKFYARVSTDQEINALQRVSGFITHNTSVILYVQSPISFDINDKVDYLGDMKIIDNVCPALQESRKMGQYRMSNDYVKNNCPKYITLR